MINIHEATYLMLSKKVNSMKNIIEASKNKDGKRSAAAQDYLRLQLVKNWMWADDATRCEIEAALGLTAQETYARACALIRLPSG